MSRTISIEHGEIKSPVLSNPAKLLRAYMQATGVFDAKQLADDLDIPVRTIQRLKLDIATATDGVADATANSATSAMDGAANSANDATDGVNPQSEPKKVSPHTPLQRNNYHLEQTSHPVSGPREGECEMGHGVFVNCETIRHAKFSISLPGIRMNTVASGLTADEIKNFCVGHALQWAAEIENGKPVRDALPDKIANFLSKTIMSSVNQRACQTATATPVRPMSAAAARTANMRAILREEATQ